MDFGSGYGGDGLVVSDFNGDGKPDVAVAEGNFEDDEGGAPKVTVLLNTTPKNSPTPSFGPQGTFATGANPTSVAAGDFNGDGKMDLVVGNLYGHPASVLISLTPVAATTPSFTAGELLHTRPL